MTVLITNGVNDLTSRYLLKGSCCAGLSICLSGHIITACFFFPQSLFLSLFGSFQLDVFPTFCGQWNLNVFGSVYIWAGLHTELSKYLSFLLELEQCKAVS